MSDCSKGSQVRRSQHRDLALRWLDGCALLLFGGNRVLKSFDYLRPLRPDVRDIDEGHFFCLAKIKGEFTRKWLLFLLLQLRKNLVARRVIHSVGIVVFDRQVISVLFKVVRLSEQYTRPLVNTSELFLDPFILMRSHLNRHRSVALYLLMLWA